MACKQADVYSSGPCLATLAPVSGRGFKLPTRKLNVRATQAFLFGIAPDKAFLAEDVTTLTGGLLHHHFTLAQHPSQTCMFRLGMDAVRFVSVELALHCCSFPLGSILPYGVRTFLYPQRTADIFVFLKRYK